MAQQSDMAPGIHFVNTAEGEEAMVACFDVTVQKMRPTVMSPDQLIEKGMKINGVEFFKKEISIYIPPHTPY